MQCNATRHLQRMQCNATRHLQRMQCNVSIQSKGRTVQCNATRHLKRMQCNATRHLKRMQCNATRHLKMQCDAITLTILGRFVQNLNWHMSPFCLSAFFGRSDPLPVVSVRPEKAPHRIAFPSVNSLKNRSLWVPASACLQQCIICGEYSRGEVSEVSGINSREVWDCRLRCGRQNLYALWAFFKYNFSQRSLAFDLVTRRDLAH